MNISIRKSELNDIGQYTELLQTSFQTTYTDKEVGLTEECFSKDIFSTKDSQKYLTSHLINNDCQATWLAFVDQRLVGSITCAIIDEQEAELSGFYVSSECQGMGIGKKLYNLALVFASKRDLLLDTYAHNVKTIQIYESWGWELDKSRGENGYFFRHWPEWPDEVEAKCVYMKLNRRDKYETK